jgi:hypothetical protein
MIHRDPEVDERRGMTIAKMRRWGITVARLAMELGVSRQYAWQLVHHTACVSREKELELEEAVNRIAERHARSKSLGGRLRAARIAAGLMLKEAAEKIGYGWVAVERWELDICRPKPGVLWHLCAVYGADWNWIAECLPLRHGPQTEHTHMTSTGIELS